MGIARDQVFMSRALALAQKAREVGEVPIGAVLVLNNEVIGAGYNQPIHLHDPTAHAEIVALRDAGQKLKNYRLVDTTLYVTLEPCIMCLGALIQARIKRLVFGALDPKIGAVANGLQGLDTRLFNHRIEWDGGCLAEACAALLRDFFKR